MCTVTEVNETGTEMKAICPAKNFSTDTEEI